MNNYSNNNGLRIWVISNMYPSDFNPRYGVFVKNFVLSLEKLGIKFPLKTYIYGQKSNRFLTKVKAYFTFFLKILTGLALKKDTYNIIYIHFPLHVAFLFLFSKKKIVLNFHGSELKQSNRYTKILFFFLKKLCKKKNVRIVVPSPFYKQKLNSILSINDNKFIIYPSGGIGLNVFKPLIKNEINRIKVLNSISVEKKIIGFISSLIENKDPFTFVKSIEELVSKKSLQNFECIIVGDGKLKNDLIEYMYSRNLTKYFKFYPVQNQTELNKFFNSIDLFVFPSREESLGLVGLEAMAVGKIVISAKNGGAETYINNRKNGYLFQPNDYEELANLICNYYELTENEKHLLSENAMKKAQEYESERVNLNLIKEMKGWILKDS
jgi:glycosyltransferase involved in cell wall biosynthesis